MFSTEQRSSCCSAILPFYTTDIISDSYDFIYLAIFLIHVRPINFFLLHTVHLDNVIKGGGVGWWTGESMCLVVLYK